jgi:hypothetical protein
MSNCSYVMVAYISINSVTICIFNVHYYILIPHPPPPPPPPLFLSLSQTYAYSLLHDSSIESLKRFLKER